MDIVIWVAKNKSLSIYIIRSDKIFLVTYFTLVINGRVAAFFFGFVISLLHALID